MKKVNVLIFMTIFVLNSCKKSDLAINSGKCRVVSVTNGVGETTPYEYDAAGRISKVGTAQGHLSYSNGTFVYGAEDVRFTENYGLKYVILTDNFGRLVRNSMDIWNSKYKYDAAGYLVYKEHDEFGFPSHRFFNSVISYSNGNLVKVVTNESITAIVTYYENEPIQNLLGFENALNSDLIFGINSCLNLTKTFNGQTSKNLVKTITRHIRGNDGVLWRNSQTYTYLKDSRGKVIQITIDRDYPADRSFHTFNFTYECI